uniref:Ribosome-binding factor A n=1 Tax=Angiostrongylus cantonensis TaxID=6313 RepID=A0A0K0DN56_ANGCA
MRVEHSVPFEFIKIKGQVRNDDKNLLEMLCSSLLKKLVSSSVSRDIRIDTGHASVATLQFQGSDKMAILDMHYFSDERKRDLDGIHDYFDETVRE